MTLIHGDCLEELKKLPDNSVDSVVTDPPYGLSFMGKKWDYDAPSEEVWRECLRVLKPGGHLLSFASTRTQHRMAVRIEDAGFEIRDMIAWVYGSGFPKSLNIGKQGVKSYKGWGTALKPALEPITVARKPLIGTVAENVLEYGTGGLNVDGCRVGTETVKNALPSYRGKTGEFVAQNQNFTKGKVEYNTGRFPANLIHDGSEEVAVNFPNDNARFFYCAKASKKDRDEGLEEFDTKQITPYCEDGNRREGRDGTGKYLPRKNFHPTVKPTDLMRYLCRLVTPPNGIVLDPFMGSGSTGKAAKLEGFRFVGIEREAEYVEIARARIENTKEPQLTLL